MIQNNKITSNFVLIASLIIILAGIKLASSIIIPILLSLFITIILAPFYQKLLDSKIPESISIIIVVFSFILIILLLSSLIGNSIEDFNSKLPFYEEKLKNILNSFVLYINAFGIEISSNELSTIFDPNVVMKYITSILKNFASILTNSFMILLMVIFMLLEMSRFNKKLLDMKTNNTNHIQNILNKIKHYMLLKTIISIFTGFIVSLILFFVDVDYFILWGVIAFLLNYIPNIGSIIAAVPAILLSLIQFGPLTALGISISYIIINIIVGSVIEPKIMGKGLGLSTLVVFLSLLFWGWLLGPTGMILSIPLTIILKITLDSNKDTKYIATLLS